MGPAAPWHAGSSQTRARTRVPRTGKQTLNHCAPREARTHGLLTEITHLVSGLNEAQVLDVSSQKEFSERQSDTEEVGSFRETHIPQTERGPSEMRKRLEFHF